jgi:transaldolase
MNPLKKIAEFGQAIWLDDIRRQMITGGELKRLVDEDGLRGMTSNPLIFQKAISESDDYDDDLRALREQGKGTMEILEAVTVKDVQMAADVFRPLYDRSGGEHGFVSLEVNPHHARNAEATLEEARRLWRSMARPNVFVKIPGTRECLPVIQQLISEGVNINITLLFGLPRYREVVEAFIAGIEQRVQRGEPVDKARSVASFFLSRIDVAVDPMLEEIEKKGGPNAARAGALRGKVAIACAREAYQIYREIAAGERWKRLEAKGARLQRLLWASTGVKNPAYSDVMYVEALIGPDTINTVPRDTLDAYRDHGKPAARLETGVDEARRQLEELAAVGINIDEVTARLEEEGIEKFRKPYDALVETVEKELAAV